MYTGIGKFIEIATHITHSLHAQAQRLLASLAVENPKFWSRHSSWSHPRSDTGSSKPLENRPPHPSQGGDLAIICMCTLCTQHPLQHQCQYLRSVLLPISAPWCTTTIPSVKHPPLPVNRIARQGEVVRGWVPLLGGETLVAHKQSVCQSRQGGAFESSVKAELFENNRNSSLVKEQEKSVNRLKNLWPRNEDMWRRPAITVSRRLWWWGPLKYF